MEFKQWFNSEPAKYWMPPKDKHIELDIVSNPSKYEEYIGSYKIDGEWSRVLFDGENVAIQSRSISKVTGTYGRKEDNVPHLVEAFKHLPPNTVILGELCLPGLNNHSKDVGSILRCLPPKAIERQKNIKIEFYCFDVVMWNGEDIHELPFIERIKYFDYVVDLCGETGYVKHATIKNIYTIVDEYEDYLAMGGEGMLLQKKSSIYNPGTRTAWSSIKLKKATELLELPIVDIVLPEIHYRGENEESWPYKENGVAVTKAYYYRWANGIEVKNGDTIVKVTSGMTEQYKEWLNTPEAHNLIVEERLTARVQAMEIEPTGSLRHPYVESILLDGKCI